MKTINIQVDETSGLSELHSSEMRDDELFLILTETLEQVSTQLAENHNCGNAGCPLAEHAKKMAETIDKLVADITN